MSTTEACLNRRADELEADAAQRDFIRALNDWGLCWADYWDAAHSLDLYRRAANRQARQRAQEVQAGRRGPS